MNHVRTLAALAAFAIAAIPATAHTSQPRPNYDAQPNYGTLTLRNGFTPDPRMVSLQAGGDISAQSVGGCQGFITTAPDVRLVFEAGSLPLIISADSVADTTLMVNAPDGSWSCDDDGGEGANPSIRFNRPQTGRYEIWVGTYTSGRPQPATLHVSELTSQ